MIKKIILLSFLTAVLPVSSLTAAPALNSANAYSAGRLAEYTNGRKARNILAIPHLAAPPVIDGIVSKGEWDLCGGFSGMRDLYTGEIMPPEKSILMRYAYDDKNFYFLMVIRGEQPAAPKLKNDDMTIFRSGNVLELMFAAPDKDPYRIAFSPFGSMTDMIKLDNSFTSNCQYRWGSSKNKNASWIYMAGFKDKYYFLECAVPRSNMQLPEKEFMFNLSWICNKKLFSLAPVNSSFSEVKNFFAFRLLPPKSNFFQGWGVGNASIGNMTVPGVAISVNKRPPQTELKIMAFKKGTEFRERTGFDEIHGALETFQRSRTGKWYRVKYPIKNTQCDHFEYTINVDGQLISQINGPVKFRNQLELNINNFPSRKKVQIKVASYQKGPFDLSVADASGKVLQTTKLAPAKTWTLDYSKWQPGKYTVSCKVGKLSSKARFNVPGKAPWKGNKLGMEQEVLPGFEPLVSSGRSFKMWNRTYCWKDSVIFSALEKNINPQLVISADGKKEPFILKKFTVKKTTPLFAELEITGQAGTTALEGSVRIEYDGLAWFDLKLSDPKSRKIDALALETQLETAYAELYHGSPLRTLNGFIPKGKKDYPWQIFFWVGNRQGGFGFVTESQQAFKTSPDASFTTNQNGSKTDFSVNFRGAGDFKSAQLSFGLQLTPVKAMPLRYSNYLTDDWGLRRGDKYRVLSDYMDFTTIWPRRCRYMDKICDPGGVNYANLKKAVDETHKRNVNAIPYFAPLSMTENAQQEFVDYYQEWVQAPISRWKSKDTVNSRCCCNSEYLDYLLYQLDKLQKASSCDGFYFDGAMPGECNNELHGCGYVDENGVRRGTFPVRKVREYLQRSAMIAWQNNKKLNQITPRKPGASPYQVWIHVSGAITPPIHSFSTAMFAGEWFKQAIKLGSNYDKLLTIEKFIPRYIGQPWGIPNYFLAIVNIRSDLVKYTDCALAYIIPHGTGLYPRYLDLVQVQKILAIKSKFNCDESSFYPPGQLPAGLKIDYDLKAAAVGIWQNKAGDWLLAAGNCTGQKQTLTIQRPGSSVKHLHGKAEIKTSGSTCTVVMPEHSLQLLLIKNK